MLKWLIRVEGKIFVCGTCTVAWELRNAELMESARHSTMAELAEETASANKDIVF